MERRSHLGPDPRAQGVPREVRPPRPRPRQGARRAGARVAVALALAAAHAGCPARDSAQVVVVVSTDLAVPAELDALEIRLRDEGGVIIEERGLSLAGTQPSGQVLGSFGIAPLDGEVARPLDVEVAAGLGGSILFKTRLKTRFRSGQKLRLDVFLARTCIAAACPDSVMCLRGECRPPLDVDPSTLPPYEGLIDSGTPAPDGGVPGDSDGGVAVDGSAPDATPVGGDGGMPGCMVSAPTRVVTAGTHGLDQLTMVWTGAELGLAWADYDPDATRQSLGFARLGADGRTRLDDGSFSIESTYTGTTAGTGAPELSWSGGEYFLAYDDTRVVPENVGEIYLARFSASTLSTPTKLQLTDTPTYEEIPVIAFDGTAFGLVWRREYSYGVFGRVSAAGDRLLVPDAELGEAYFQDLAWDPIRAHFVLAYSRGDDAFVEELHVDVLNGSGEYPSGFPAEPLTDTPWGSVQPSLVVTPDEYAVAWLDGRGASDPWDVWFQRLDTDGRPKAQAIILDSPPVIFEGPSIAWSAGGGYVVAIRDGDAIRLARATTDGRSRVQQLMLRDPASGRAVVVAAGATFAIAWPDSLGINVATATCP